MRQPNKITQWHERGSNKTHNITKNLLVNSRKGSDDESSTQTLKREEMSTVSEQEGTFWVTL